VVQNLQLHLRLGAGATLQHLRIVTPGAQDRVAHHLHARSAAGRATPGPARHGQRATTCSAGDRAGGERAEARSAGCCWPAVPPRAAGAPCARRAAPPAHVEALALASGKARAVVNAHTRIAPGADEAEVRQRLHGVPTGGQPRLVLRPHLEIHHDQVQAAHGATWGACPRRRCSTPPARPRRTQRARPDPAKAWPAPCWARPRNAPVVESLGLDERLLRQRWPSTWR
jgi:Fe-S cluster assembly protein SufD